MAKKETKFTWGDLSGREAIDPGKKYGFAMTVSQTGYRPKDVAITLYEQRTRYLLCEAFGAAVLALEKDPKVLKVDLHTHTPPAPWIKPQVDPKGPNWS